MTVDVELLMHATVGPETLPNPASKYVLTCQLLKVGAVVKDDAPETVYSHTPPGLPAVHADEPDGSSN